MKDETNGKETTLEVDLGGNIRPFQVFQNEDLNKGTFLSFGDKMVLRLKTAKNPVGNGFRAVYRTGIHNSFVLVNLRLEKHAFKF